jgi:hypothetical protein
MANAGVVGMAEVVTPNSTTSSSGVAGSVAMWSFVWVGVSVLFLMFIHVAMVRR